MKKLEKLTLKELDSFDQVSIIEDQKIIIGGSDPDLSIMSVPGWSENIAKYGETIPTGCYYDSDFYTLRF